MGRFRESDKCDTDRYDVAHRMRPPFHAECRTLHRQRRLGAADGRLAVCSWFVLRQPNRGVAAARNLGIQSASHAWVAFVDADDIWLPGKLQAQWALLQSHPEARMAYAAWEVWPSIEAEPSAALLAELHSAEGDTTRWGGPEGWIYPDLLLSCCVWTSTVLAQRALLMELGGFDPALRMGEDYKLWLQASRLTPILRMSRPCALYRQHPANVTKTVPPVNFRGEVLGGALRRWGYRGPDGRTAPRAEVMRNLARSWSDFAGAQFGADHLPVAQRAALKALRLNPAEWLAWKVLARATWRSMARPVGRLG